MYEFYTKKKLIETIKKIKCRNKILENDNICLMEAEKEWRKKYFEVMKKK